MPNKVYQVAETAITWRASGGTNVLTLTSLATAAGRQGAHHDFGTAARAQEFAWRFFCIPTSAPTVGAVIEIYWKSSDGTNPDNDDGTGDAAVSAADKLRNLTLLGVMVADEAAAVTMVRSGGPVALPHRYGAPVIWSRLGVALSATAGNHGFDLIPLPLEIQ